LFSTSEEAVIMGEIGDVQRHMLSFIHRTDYNHYSKTAKDEYDTYPEPDWIIAVCVRICFQKAHHFFEFVSSGWKLFAV
jgi:hypothetical protein